MPIRHAFPVRLLMALAALAMIAAPAFLADGGAAHAAQMDAAAMAADHCTGMPGMDDHRHHKAPSNDCIASCLAAYAAVAPQDALIDYAQPAVRRGMLVLNMGRLIGHPPGIDPPPPRFA